MTLLALVLAASTLPMANFPKVPKGTGAGAPRSCPIPLAENFCSTDANNISDVLTRHEAEIDILQALGLDDLANPSGNKTFTIGDNHLEFRWTQPVTGPQFDGALELQASGNFSGDLLHIHQFTGNPPAGTDLLHLESEDADVTPIRITAGGDDAIIANKRITASGFVGPLTGNVTGTASGNPTTAVFEARLAALESAVAALGGGTSPVQAPTCSTISPTSGPVGTAVSVTGTAFNTATAVTFPTARSASFSKLSDTQITAVVPASAVDGAFTITTASPTPATCPSFDVTAAPSGDQFYVATTGSGSACTSSAPCASIAAAIPLLGPGDTLNVAAGTYTTPQSGSFMVDLPDTLKGTSTDRITIRGAGKGVTILRPTTTNHVIYANGPATSLALNHDPTNCTNARCATNVAQYVTIRDLTIDAVNALTGVKLDLSGTSVNQVHGAHHLRFESVEIKNARQHGVLTYGDYNEFVGMEIHDNGQTNSPQTHGMYIAGKKNTILGGSIYRNMCQGVQFWSGYGSHEPSDNVIDAVALSSNGANAYGNCGSADKGGVGMYCGARNVVQNSAIDNNRGAGIYVDSGSWGIQLLGNTISNNNVVDGTAGILISTAMHTGCDAGTTHEPLDPDVPGAARAVATNTVVNSNVLWGNGTGGDTAPNNEIKDDGISTDLDPVNTAGP